MASSMPRTPVSHLLNDKTKEEEPKKKSREDWRRAKELEEARKAGTAPAAVDEEGRDINPHIPQYISSAPWYFGSAGPTLKHQRPQEEKQQQFSGLDEWYKRGVDNSKIATKYRKGACENCGAMTHQKRDCMDRPRKIGAKFTGAEIAADEHVQPNLQLDYDGKRDRWSGYDPKNHREIVEEYVKVEEAKRLLKAEKLKDNPDASLSEDDEDEDKYVDEVDMPGTKVDSKQRITVRNLRIREDTAKYLRNLDPNSAYYDPKTRSMRDNPDPKSHPEEVEFAGENFVRFTGDTQKHAKAQLFAWEAYGKGVDVHLLAEPTKLELLQQEYDKKKEEFKSQVKDTILEKYGGEEHLQVPPKSLLLAQTENYTEYSRSGKIIKGQEKQIIRSRYEEDVYLNNHTTVWGSYWNIGKWGYACCHSFVKNSYCIGETGKSNSDENNPSGSKNASEIIDRFNPANQPDSENELEPEIDETRSSEHNSSSSDDDAPALATPQKKTLKKKSKKIKQKEKRRHKNRSAKKSKEDDKLKKALKAEDRHNAKVAELMKLDERKRPYNSMYEVKAPTEEEVEAFMMKRKREEDPMLQFMDK